MQQHDLGELSCDCEMLRKLFWLETRILAHSVTECGRLGWFENLMF